MACRWPSENQRVISDVTCDLSYSIGASMTVLADTEEADNLRVEQ